MTTIMPQGEDIRKAVKWISEERQSSPGRKLSKLVEEAAVRFNEYLSRFFSEQKG
jgi:hypothetical protein